MRTSLHRWLAAPPGTAKLRNFCRWPQLLSEDALFFRWCQLVVLQTIQASHLSQTQMGQERLLRRLLIKHRLWIRPSPTSLQSLSSNRLATFAGGSVKGMSLFFLRQPRLGSTHAQNGMNPPRASDPLLSHCSLAVCAPGFTCWRLGRGACIHNGLQTCWYQSSGPTASLINPSQKPQSQVYISGNSSYE